LTVPRPYIVDISGLADVLVCSKSLVLKTWRSYPHFFIGAGNDARGARFDVNDVVEHLKHASMGQEDEQLQGARKDKRPPSDDKNGFPVQGRCKALGTKHQARSKKRPTRATTGRQQYLLSGL